MPQEPTNDKITLTWTDLNSRKVDSRLKEQDALARTRKYAQMPAEAAPLSEPAMQAGGRLWYNAVVYMAVFGLLGGLLAWTLGQAMERFKPAGQEQATELLAAMQRVRDANKFGRLSAADARTALAEIRWLGRRNPHFQLADTELSESEREIAKQNLKNNELKVFIAQVMAYGLCGIVIAVFLAVAEPLVERNFPAVLVNGSVAAALGLLGGVVVAFVVDRLHQAVLGPAGGEITFGRQVLARTATWGVMGLFLTLAPGLVMWNFKKFAIGLLGGLVGGLIGGAVYEPIRLLTERPDISRLVALIAIGVIAGVGTGVIENVAKTGWLRVVTGLIAGKQFILYRNPTFIGSGPDCQIFLFKDPNVGRRHAALHIVPGGFEIEDLPLGAPTYVNRRPIKRARLRDGDQIVVGATTLLFQEKTPAQR